MKLTVGLWDALRITRALRAQRVDLHCLPHGAGMSLYLGVPRSIPTELSKVSRRYRASQGAKGVTCSEP